MNSMMRSDRDTVWSSGPIVRDEQLDLFQRFDTISGRRFIPFTTRVLWLREAHGKILFFHAGVEMMDGSQTCDCGQYLDAVESAAKFAVEEAKTYKVRRKDRLTVEVHVTITDTPVLLDESPEGMRHNAHPERRRQYLRVPGVCSTSDYWFTSDQPTEDLGDDVKVYPRLERIEVVSAKRVFSTAEGFRLTAATREWIATERAAAARLAEMVKQQQAKGDGGNVQA